MTEEAKQATQWLAKREESGQLIEGCKIGKITKIACAKRIRQVKKHLNKTVKPNERAPEQQWQLCNLCVLDRRLTELKQQGIIDE